MVCLYMYIRTRICFFHNPKTCFFLAAVLQSVSSEVNSESHLRGCTPDGSYLDDYSAVYALITNAELQPVKVMMSYALVCIASHNNFAFLCFPHLGTPGIYFTS